MQITNSGEHYPLNKLEKIRETKIKAGMSMQRRQTCTFTVAAWSEFLTTSSSTAELPESESAITKDKNM